jgi:hypothetical protein
MFWPYLVKPNFQGKFQPEKGTTQLEDIAVREGKEIDLLDLLHAASGGLGKPISLFYCILEVLSTTSSIFLYISRSALLLY